MSIPIPTAYYHLESDGTDSIGGTIGTLTGTNPTFQKGFFGNGASFASASSQYLESSTFAGTDDWTFAFVYNATTLPTSHTPICRDLVTANNRVWQLVFNATQATLFAWGTGGAFHQTTSANHGMVVGSYYVWSASWDNANNVVTLYKNGVSFATITLTGNEKADHASVKLSVGRSGDASNYTNGIIDQVYYKDAALTASQHAELANSAVGQIYPFTDVVATPQTGGGGGNTTHDGGTTSGYYATMQLAHDVVTGDGAGVSDTGYGIRALNNGSGNYLNRIGMTFDTSALTAQANIISATLSLYGTSTNYVNQSSTSAVIVGYTPASNNTIAASDFGNFQFTAFCTPIAFASLNQNAYNDFVLNSSGLANISKTGITKFGCITEIDRAVTTITTQDNIFTFRMSDFGANKPRLSITYSVGGVVLRKAFGLNQAVNRASTY